MTFFNISFKSRPRIHYYESELGSARIGFKTIVTWYFDPELLKGQCHEMDVFLKF